MQAAAVETAGHTAGISRLGQCQPLWKCHSSTHSLAASRVVAPQQAPVSQPLSLGSFPNEPAGVELCKHTRAIYSNFQSYFKLISKFGDPTVNQHRGRRYQDSYTVQGDSTVTSMIGYISANQNGNCQSLIYIVLSLQETLTLAKQMESLQLIGILRSLYFSSTEQRSHVECHFSTLHQLLPSTGVTWLHTAALTRAGAQLCDFPR